MLLRKETLFLEFLLQLHELLIQLPYALQSDVLDPQLIGATNGVDVYVPEGYYLLTVFQIKIETLCITSEHHT